MARPSACELANRLAAGDRRAVFLWDRFRRLWHAFSKIYVARQAISASLR
jgi:hypothetical protein